MNPAQRAERIELQLTPLTPVHVGTGEDFDPTGYVIDGELLYHFDPAAVALEPADRRALLACVNRPGPEAILAVQRFFHERAPACKAAARVVVPVVPGVAAQYRERVGRVAQREAGGRSVANRLEIERTVHHPHSGAAYLPGTSLKGAVRTAWLDRVNGGRPREGAERAQRLEQRLLGFERFEADPFRLLAIGDAAGADVASQVFYSTNHKKRPILRDGHELPAQGPVARRECIAPAQYAALRTWAAVDKLAGISDPVRTPAPPHRLPGWAAVAAACNRYYLPRLRRELELLSARRLAAPGWVQALRELLQAMAPALEGADAVLLRVGRHSGAECVTLDGVREIRIMRGRGQPAAQGSEATTVWLAATHENARSGMLPFGWVLAHRAGTELPALRRWCDMQPRPDLDGARQALAAARADALRRAAEAAARQAALQAQAAREADAAERELLRLRSLSPEGREVEALRAQLLARAAARPQPVSGALYAALRQLVARAEQGGWAAEDRRALAELMRTLVPRKIDLGGRAKEVRQAAARLDPPT